MIPLRPIGTSELSGFPSNKLRTARVFNGAGLEFSAEVLRAEFDDAEIQHHGHARGEPLTGASDARALATWLSRERRSGAH